jgi:hypothetical protein
MSHSNFFNSQQGEPELKKLQNGPPEYLPQLEEMFRVTAVDGSSSCIPGQIDLEEVEGAGEQEDDEKLAADIIRPLDPEFRTVHQRLQSPRFAPFFNNCIGATDEMHIPVVVPAAKVVQHTGRHGYPTQNVLAICDFNMRFTSVVAGWPGLVHDMRVFNDAIRKYGDKFPHPPSGKLLCLCSLVPLTCTISCTHKIL